MADDRQTVSVEKACELTGLSRRSVYMRMEDNSFQFKYVPGCKSRRLYVDTLRTRKGNPVSWPDQAPIAH